MKKTIVVFNMALLAVLLAIWQAESRPEWRDYQIAYGRTAGAAPARRGPAPPAAEVRVQIKQVEVGDSLKVDRCPTCHLGIDDPFMAGAPEPFRLHPPITDTHPPDKFGCTPCHGGESRGLAVETAHGEAEAWPNRLLKEGYLWASCFRCHGSATRRTAAALPLRGEALFKLRRCAGCHQAGGDRASVEATGAGPDLSTVGARRDWVWIQSHMLNPQSLSPGSTMPPYRLSRREAQAITAYLLTLVDSAGLDDSLLPKEVALPVAGVPATGTSPPGPISADASEAPTAATGRRPSAPRRRAPVRIPYKGERLFSGTGCRYCHRIGKTGGEAGPALTHIARKLGARRLADVLRDPAAFAPNGHMPQMYLTARQVDALVAYLLKLR